MARTPGPWQVQLQKHSLDSHCFKIRSKNRLVATTRSFIAEHDYAHEAESNARLIAAAPELLEHGERALAALEVAVEIGGGNPKTHHACANLRTAIAKAKGPQP